MLRPRSRLLFGDDVPKSALRLSGASKSITGGTLAEGRTSSATYIDTDGLLKTAAANVPVWENGGLRHEGPATNLCLYSEQQNNAIWAKGANCVVTANQAMSINGLNQADLYSLTATTLRTLSQNNIQVTNDLLYSLSIYIKAITDTYEELLFTFGNYTQKNITVSQGWFRDIVSSLVTGSAGITKIQIYDYSGGTGNRFYMDCVQFEQGYPSSYIPTTSAAVTRATCALSVPLVLNQNFYQKSAIVMRVRAKHANSATAKSWLTPSTTAEGLIDNGSGALTFVDSAANTATANLTSWAADTIISVAIVTDNVTGLMSLSASKDNGVTWIDSADTAFAGLTVGANWLLFSANTQVFECLGWNVIKSNKGFAQMKAYAKANALRLTQ
jgi:hypothetical protein